MKWNKKLGRISAVSSFVLLALWAGSAFSAVEQKTIQIAAGGKSDYAIVVPDPGSAKGSAEASQVEEVRIMQAASLLQTNIFRSAGALLPIIKEVELPKGTPAFYLGKTAAAAKAGLAVDKVKGWSCLVKAVGKDVFIVGEDARDPINDKREIVHQGTLKGVVIFLEAQLGARFLIPGEYGSRIPKHDPLAVDANMNLSSEPRFDYVIGRAPRDRVMAVALNLFGATPILKSYGGHSYYDAVPEKEYGKTHPEYFAMRGGVRNSKENHLCISNPEVQELMLKEMEKQLDKGYQWVELAQTDGYNACQCEKCTAIHTDEAERLWIVHRKLAEEMQKRRPGKKVMIISYGPTRYPPVSFKTFPDNVVIQVCTYTPENFERWAPFNVDKTVYVYNWGSYFSTGYAPTRTPKFAVDQVRRFLANKVRGIYLCGGYEADISYGLSGPAMYAFGRALANPDIEPGDILEEYVNALFGESAAPMRAFYRGMYDRLETYSLFSCPNVPVGGVFNSMSTPEDYFCHVFPPKLLNDMSLNLARARAMAKDERVRETLGMVELEFNYVKNIASIYHVYRAYRVSPTPALFDELARKMDERKALLDGMYAPDGKCSVKMPGGLPLSFTNIKRKDAEMNGRTMGLRPPFSWDFAMMKEKGILPGSGKTRRIEVAKATGIKLDGDFDKGVWKDIPAQELNEIGMGKAPNATRFKAAYDTEAFYIAVECAFDSDEWMGRLKPMGRDGNTWAQECIELVIDPFGEREKHCQIVFSPVENSTFDARRGYIDDPVHPLFGKPDISWNGEWEYAARIDKDKKRWTAEARIPFRTLEAGRPEPGTLWTMNVGRAEWPVDHSEGGQGRYSTWSPNLEGRDFHDRTSFGEVVFK